MFGAADPPPAPPAPRVDVPLAATNSGGEVPNDRPDRKTEAVTEQPIAVADVPTVGADSKVTETQALSVAPQLTSAELHRAASILQQKVCRACLPGRSDKMPNAQVKDALQRRKARLQRRERALFVANTAPAPPAPPAPRVRAPSAAAAAASAADSSGTQKSHGAGVPLAADSAQQQPQSAASSAAMPAVWAAVCYVCQLVTQPALCSNSARSKSRGDNCTANGRMQ